METAFIKIQKNIYCARRENFNFLPASTVNNGYIKKFVPVVSISGFTFVEFAISLSILATILVYVFNILNLNIKSVKEEERQIDFRHNAKAAVNQIIQVAEKNKKKAEATRGGKIIVNGDDISMSDMAFNANPQLGVFAQNIGKWFTGGLVGNFLVYSTDAGLVGDSLSNIMVGAGHTWKKNIGEPFTVENLKQYHGIFIGGNNLDNNQNTILIEYVKGGGNVYVMASPNGIVQTYNLFLNTFALNYALSPNGYSAVYKVESSHYLFKGLTDFYYDNGNDISIQNEEDPRIKNLVSINNHNLLTVYDTSNILNYNVDEKLIYCQASKSIDLSPRSSNDNNSDLWYYYEADKFGTGNGYGEIRDKDNSVYAEYINSIYIKDEGSYLKLELTCGKFAGGSVEYQAVITK